MDYNGCLKKEEVDAFEKWAFGDKLDYKERTLVFMKKWNALHSDIFELSSDGRIFEDISRMINAWRIS
jgi:hypothetical protein